MHKGRSERHIAKFGEVKVPPRNLLKMIGIVRYRVNAFPRYLETMAELVPNEGTEFREQFDDLVPWTVTDSINPLLKLAERLQDDFNSSLDYFADSPRPGLDALLSAFKRSQEFHFPDLTDLADRITEGGQKIRENVEAYRGTDYYPKYVMAAVSRLYSYITRLPAMINSLKSIRSYIDPLKIIEQRYTDSGDKDSMRPDTEPVEVLYHATISADTVARDGFSADIPLRGGLGGEGGKKTQPLISFTSDLAHAKEMMRNIKEATLLMQGTYSPHMLLRHIRNDPHGEEILRYFKVNYGRTTPRNQSELFDLYKMYLTLSGKRYNPVFFGDPKDFADVFGEADYGQAGIVAASVDMSHPDIKYLDAMREYRVPLSAVIKIEKVIK